MSDLAHARGPVARLALCQDALAIRERLSVVPENQARKARILVGKRLGAIRRTLTGHESEGLADELLSPSMAQAKLREALDAARDGTDAQKFETATHVRAVNALLRRLRIAEAETGLADQVGGLRSDILDLCAEWTTPRRGETPADLAVDSSIVRGKFSEQFRAEIKDAAAQPEAHTIRPDPKLEERSEEIGQVLAYLRIKARDIGESSGSLSMHQWALCYYDGDSARCEKWVEAAVGTPYEALFAEYRRVLIEEKIPADQAVAKAREAAAQAVRAPRIAAGQKAIDEVLSASPITPDAAQEWANAQEITPPAVSRLKKMKYPIANVRRDMAEFYRFTGGRVTAIRIHSKGDRRANATQIESVNEVGTINLDGQFDRRTLWHELAHHIEADPVAKEAAGRFIRRRSTDGDKAYTLRSLTGNSGYRSDEVAFKDGFFSPYVGKVYQSGATEVFSMGVESFSDPEELARRMANDPETLEFVAGFLKAEPSPMLKVFLSLRDTLRDITAENMEGVEDAVDTMIAKLAAGVSVRMTSDTSWLPEWAAYSIQRNGYKLAGVLEGGREGVLLLTGRVRNWDTKRSVSGLILGLSGKKEDGREFFQMLGHFPGKDMNTPKAAYAIYSAKGHIPDQRDMQSEKFLSEYAK